MKFLFPPLGVPAKRTVASIIIFLAASLATFGDTFYGTISETITSTNDPSYVVGETFYGCYQYESATIDGTFCTAGYGAPAPGNSSLTGNIFVTTPNGAAGWGQPIGLVSLAPDVNPSHLTVTGGVVTDFSWDYLTEYGFGCSIADGNSSFGASGDRDVFDPTIGQYRPEYWISTEGSLCLSAPVKQVPDASNTLALLALSLLGFIALRRRFAT